MRRIAAHEVVEGGHVLRQAVVEITGDRVGRCYEFCEEMAHTEWLGGRIDIVDGQALYSGKILREENNL